jgi:hypothetical protein
LFVEVDFSIGRETRPYGTLIGIRLDLKTPTRTPIGAPYQTKVIREQGQAQGTKELFPLVYDELRRISGHTAPITHR